MAKTVFFQKRPVAVYKLRKGVVVGLEIESPVPHITYAHIEDLHTRMDGSVYLGIRIGSTHKIMRTEELTWLEP